MKYFTADFHFGEERLEIMQRPFSSTEEMHKEIIKNFSEILTEDDELYILGDVCNKNHPETLGLLDNIPGKKILIRGNHDAEITDEEFAKYFDKIITEGEGILLKCDGIDCYATHYPTRGLPQYFNLVGHIHSAWKVQLNMLNVGVDVNHWGPVPENRIKFLFETITDFYDEDVWVAYNEINQKYEGKRGKEGRYFND